MLAAIALSIVLNFTRGVWLGCFLATVYLLARWKPGWLWGVPVLVAAGYLAAPALVRERVILAFHPWRDPALSMRFEMWRVGLRMIQRHPMVGVGLNNVEQVYDLYLPSGKTPEIGYHGHLHNNFIQLAAERGLPCLGAWLWFMGALGWQFIRIRRRLISGIAPWVADAAFAGWLAFAVEGFFEYNFGTSPVLMLFLFVVSTPFAAERFERAG
jgi:O-antigen ligase